MTTTDFVVHFNEDGSERIEITSEPGFAILLRMWSGGEEVDVAALPEETEELIRLLREAIEVARAVELPMLPGALIKATLKDKSARNSEARLYSRLSGGGTVWMNLDNQSLHRENEFDEAEVLFEGVRNV